MKITKSKLRRIISKVVTESYRMPDIPDAGKGSIEDIIQLCVDELTADPSADVEAVVRTVASAYSIPYDMYEMIETAVYQRL